MIEKSEIFQPAESDGLVTSKGGASIRTLDYNTISNQGDYWYISTRDRTDGFALLLSLNQAWGFHPTSNSVIEITINGTTSYNHHKLNSILDLDALFSFSVEQKQYFSTYIRLQSKFENRIYPKCSM